MAISDLRPMRSARVVFIVVLFSAVVLNEWAFRLFLPSAPIDSFLRMMVLVLDLFVIVFLFWTWAGSTPLSVRLKTTIRKHPRWLSLFVGSLFAYGILLSIEFSCRYYFKHIYQAPYAEATYWEPSALERDSILGSTLVKDTVISHAYVVNDSLIYKRYYRTDGFRRRINPPTHADSTYNEFIMVTGCSFAFGYGLPEKQTLSYYLDSITGKRGYNYGVSGHGTQQTLALLESREISQETEEENGVLVHLFIDEHIQRLIGSRRLIKLWAQNFPYYYLDGDSLKRDGSFWTGRHLLTRFYRAIGQSAFIDLFDIDIPWYVSDAHLELFGAVLKEAKSAFTREFPNGRFVVVIAPNSKLADRATKLLSDNQVEVLDLSDLLDKDNKRYKIHWTEGHPNGNYYLEIATEIDRYLKN